MVIYIKKRIGYLLLCLLALFCFGFIFYKYVIINNKKDFIAGAFVINQELEEQQEKEVVTIINNEKHFRPSKLPVLNNKDEVNELINNYYDKEVNDISIPIKFIKSPEDTILNYFSLLREAANPSDSKYIGCGSLGDGNRPYPIAYNFFDYEYKKKVSFNTYKDSFSNMFHISLIKYKEVQSDNENLKYFYEIEVIQALENNIASFTYYYGFIELGKSGDGFKILDISITPENYLCAPYHGWVYDAASKVEIEYGNWCKLIKKMGKTEVDGYVKNIYFLGNDNKNYKIQFYTLTNDYDIEVSQYVQNSNGKWEYIKLNPEDCLKK
ncbi:hypothetical protein PMY38_14915 [Clostridium tertium]|uniref:hypothetical protein n=1 Tax=Clostridium tertium TaxID=1559 RepID=UPI00232CC181|nr:hypothetical protein [Clostridium tertium]MDB1954558.1 hypothetical protein [Clostridium tertium]MDB1959888.1 hypothetical protein [Clostridium tertium]MDB1960875.1 hypothetical protein [Clostridium tertium]MDB1965543.1 hypothetical protein [Clostridium tertium]